MATDEAGWVIVGMVCSCVFPTLVDRMQGEECVAEKPNYLYELSQLLF